jgi:protein-L-isoaspartate O-methyltransferase
MNMQTDIIPDSAQAADGNQLAQLANIKDLTDGRDRAIELWIETYETLHRNTAAASKASIGGTIHLSVGHGNRNTEGEHITQKLISIAEARHYDRATSKTETFSALEDYARSVTREVDRQCWSNLMTKLGFDTLLDRQAREEFQASLKNDPPIFNVENCQATFSSIWGDRREMYLRGIANVFMKMDRRFRSHDAFAIGNRLIIERAMNADSWGGWSNYNRRDTLHDVERIFRELDGVGPIGMNERLGIVYHVEQAKKAGGLPTLVEGDYFRVRVFQNGNLHLWFERKDLLVEVNKLLMEYYKPVEGDVGEGPTYESAPLFHKTPAKNFGQFFSSQDVADRVIGLAEIQKGDTVLEPSAGSGMLARAARSAGAIVTCFEIQPGLAYELRVLHGFHDTSEADFLTMLPTRLYDKIVMNPPFDRGRDCDHVRHAYEFLKPGGTLVAVMSARAEFGTDARHKALHDLVAKDKNKWGGGGGQWRDLPERSFAHAGTNVNTVMLRLEKPRS